MGRLINDPNHEISANMWNHKPLKWTTVPCSLFFRKSIWATPSPGRTTALSIVKLKTAKLITTSGCLGWICFGFLFIPKWRQSWPSSHGFCPPKGRSKAHKLLARLSSSTFVSWEIWQIKPKKMNQAHGLSTTLSGWFEGFFVQKHLGQRDTTHTFRTFCPPFLT